MDGVYAVPEAAEQLGLSPRRVRALIETGALPGDRVGQRWLIPAEAISDYNPRLVGRPLAPALAWACLRLLAGEDPGGVSPSHLNRLRHRMTDQLRGDPGQVADKLRSWCLNRARVEKRRLLAPVIADVARDARLVLAGWNADPLVNDRDRLDAYVAETDLPQLVHDHFLGAPGPRGRVPNLILRAVPSLDVVPRDPERPHLAAPVVVGVDLLDSREPRAWSAGAAHVRTALSMWETGLNSSATSEGVARSRRGRG